MSWHALIPTDTWLTQPHKNHVSSYITFRFFGLSKMNALLSVKFTHSYTVYVRSGGQ